MRLRRLALTDFRGFAELDLEFPESAQTTALVGINGAGKTSILDAIARALSWLSPGTLRTEGFDDRNIRNGQTASRVGVKADIVVGSWSEAIE